MIDQRIRYKEGSNKPERPKPEEKPSGFDPFYGSEGENLIPFPRDRIKPWWEDEASVNPEALAFEFWFDRWQEHEFRDQFNTLKDFVSWSLSNEDQPFHRGGIASLIK